MPSLLRKLLCLPSKKDHEEEVTEKPKASNETLEEVEQLRKNKQDLERELGELKKKNEEAQETAKTKYADQEARLKQFQADAKKYKNEANAAGEKSKALQGEVDRLQLAMEQERDANKKQNEEREVVMESLKAFLDTHDDVDASTLGSNLSHVNDLVEQLASDLIFRWEAPEDKPSMDPSSEIPRRLGEIIGHDLVQALLTCNMNDDGSPSLLQYAFQAALLARVQEFFESRTFSSKEFELIGKLSHKIREEEIQPMYGRWRSVTQKYLRATSSPDDELVLTAKFIRDASIDIHNIALLFGYPVTESPTDIQQEFEQSLSDIVNKVVKLANAITGEIVTKDYELLRPTRGRFDPESMDTPFPLSESPQVDDVFCTVFLGMTSIGKPGRQQVPPEHRVFRKAGVITKATLKEIMNPPSTQKRGAK